MALEGSARQRLRKDVSRVLVAADHDRRDHLFLHELADLELAPGDVLGPSMGDRVVREVDGPAVVHAERGWAWGWVSQLGEQAAQEHRLAGRQRAGHDLGLA
eukprot:3494717-Lingulodinium_polyedra.AAC.1